MTGKQIFCTIILCLAILSISTSDSKAQPPAPPAEHGINGNQGAGGAAPVDGGSLLLLIGGMGYGVVKLIRGKKVV
jgi:hypothetical protein